MNFLNNLPIGYREYEKELLAGETGFTDYNGEDLYKGDEVYIVNDDYVLVGDMKKYLTDLFGEPVCYLNDWRGNDLQLDSYYFMFDGELIQEDETEEFAQAVFEKINAEYLGGGEPWYER